MVDTAMVDTAMVDIAMVDTAMVDIAMVDIAMVDIARPTAVTRYLCIPLPPSDEPFRNDGHQEDRPDTGQEYFPDSGVTQDSAIPSRTSTRASADPR